jgi:hypothetical protein
MGHEHNRKSACSLVCVPLLRSIRSSMGVLTSTRRENPTRGVLLRSCELTIKVTLDTLQRSGNVRPVLFRLCNCRPRTSRKKGVNLRCQVSLGFPVWLRVPTNPQTNAVVEETSSASTFTVSFQMNTCYYDQDLLTRLLTQRISAVVKANLGYLPYFSEDSFLCLSLFVQSYIVPQVRSRPFSGLPHSAGKLLRTS